MKANEVEPGMVFDRLTTFKEVSPVPYVHWFCTCECGNTAVVSVYHLLSGHTKSCGCLAKEMESKANTTHGERSSIEYAIWCNMKSRCTNTNDIRYGGRGIKVCERWLNSFPNFLEDMGQRPSSEHSIDRINNDGDYEKGNCKWATKIEQANNRSTNKLVKIKNEELITVAQLARATGINVGTLTNRLNRGMAADEAVNTPLIKAKLFSYRNLSLNLLDWSIKLNIPWKTLYSRLNSYGWTFEKTVETPLRNYSMKTVKVP